MKWRGVDGFGAAAVAMDATTVRQEIDRLSNRDNARRVLVRLSSVPTDAERAELAAHGISLLSYVGDNSFFATLSDRPTGITQTRTGLSVQRVAAVELEHKVDEFIAADNIPSYAPPGRSGRARRRFRPRRSKWSRLM